MEHSIARPKLFPEKNYDAIMQWIGTGQYQIVDQYKDLPEGIFSKQPAWNTSNFVLAASGATTCDCSFSYTYKTRQGVQKDTQNIVVPSNSEIIIVRFLRYDETHGPPHYNADDQIIFPTKQGDIFRMSRNDAPDHYLLIVANSTVADIAGAYKLPELNNGPINTYTEKGASLPIELFRVSDE